MLRWIQCFCSSNSTDDLRRYVLFIDDDYFLNLNRLLQYLDQLDKDETLNEKDRERFVTGYLYNDSRPRRLLTDRWFVSLKDYPYNRYPPYVTAGCFLMSQKASSLFDTAARYIPVFRFDDIYLGLLAYSMSIRFVGNNDLFSSYGSLFSRWRPFDDDSYLTKIVDLFRPNRQAVIDEPICVHGYREQQLIDLWNRIHSSNISLNPWTEDFWVQRRVDLRSFRLMFFFFVARQLFIDKFLLKMFDFESSICRSEQWRTIISFAAWSKVRRQSFYSIELWDLRWFLDPIKVITVDRGRSIRENIYSNSSFFTWLINSRFSFSSCLRFGLNSYVYAPKDDLKHRSKWRDLYSNDELAELAQLINYSKRCGLSFIYALSPGLDLTYSSEKDLLCLKRKFDQVLFIVVFVGLGSNSRSLSVVELGLSIVGHSFRRHRVRNVSTRQKPFRLVRSWSSLDHKSDLRALEQTDDLSLLSDRLNFRDSSEWKSDFLSLSLFVSCDVESICQQNIAVRWPSRVKRIPPIWKLSVRTSTRTFKYSGQVSLNLSSNDR